MTEERLPSLTQEPLVDVLIVPVHALQPRWLIVT